ncbi:MAG: flavin reductase family protein [Actinobacteria bacterium]|nr:flavin reductase family protein [Actinomycetota bacterium]
MVIVTTAADGERAGCLVGFHTQASIDPLRYLVLLSVANATYRVALQADHLAVHVLDERDRGLAELFGSETGDDVDKFAQVPWTAGPGGVPLLEVANRFVGRIVDRSDAGDHVVFLIEPVVAATSDSLTQLSALSMRDLEPGHEP